MTEFVHIKSCTADDPVYHASDPYRPWPDIYNDREDLPYAERYRAWVVDWYEKMNCGVRLPMTATFIQRERADRIARPCKRCFP